MTNERELKVAQIEQNETDRQKLINEGEKLVAELAALDEPKLKHGDIRLWYNSASLGIVDKSEPKMHMIWAVDDKRSNWLSEEKVLKDSVPAGTLKDIFDDLKRNSEDLGEFKVDGGCFTFTGVCSGVGRIYLQTAGAWMSVETATRIYQNLGQMIAFAKRIVHGT